MKKRTLVSCLLLALVMTLSCVLAIGAWASGTVTMTDFIAGESADGKVVTIATAEELYMLRDYTAAGNPTEDMTFKLVASFDLPEVVAKDGDDSLSNLTNPSNSPDIGTAEHPFMGSFDGNGETIGNLWISKWSAKDGSDATETARGIFAYTEDAFILDLSVEVTTVRNAKKDVGAIVGNAKNTIILGCAVDGDLAIKGVAGRVAENLGGIVGFMDGGCIEACTVNADLSGKRNVGGVAGLATGGAQIVTVIVAGNVGIEGQKTVDGAANFGGVVGCLDNASVINVISYANVYAKTEKDASVAGGIVGAIKGEGAVIANVATLGTVTATAGDIRVAAGAIAGNAEGGTITSAFALNSNKFVGIGAVVPTATATFDAELAITEATADVKAKTLVGALNAWIVADGDAYFYWQILEDGTFGQIEEEHEHSRGEVAACQDSACPVCQIPMEATAEHVRPEAPACKEGVTCSVCEIYVFEPTAEHDVPADAPACKEDLHCTACDKHIEPTKAHRVLSQADCLNDAKCADCSLLRSPYRAQSGKRKSLRITRKEFFQ